MIIDMQQAFVRDLSNEDRNMIVLAQCSLLRQCAQYDVPVIVVEYEYSGETLWTLKQILSSVSNVTTVVKGYDNAFIRTNLHSVLRQLDVSTIVVSGINASACVRKTVRSALWRGFSVVISDNLIADAVDMRTDDKNRPWYRRNVHFCDTELPALPALVPPTS